jgi:DNA polymerase-3 subunit delta'
MLDEYIDKQNIVYRQLKKALNNNLSHAYLFITNDNIYANDIIMSFVKSIICPKNYTNNSNCSNCIVCSRIDNEEYTEVKVIRPDGLWIKKEQLFELQKEFSTKPIEGSKRVYVIYEVDKLNKQAANSILKFLEEPAEDIIAILITNNINLVVDTIVSRCLNIIFKSNKLEDYIDEKTSTLEKLFYIFKKESDLNMYLNDEKNKIFVDSIIEFIKKYEDTKIKMINNTKKYFHDIFKTKEDIEYVFDIIILFYKEVLHYILNKKINIFNDYTDDIISIANKNEKYQIINKLNKIVNAKELIKNNINSNLLIDKLIIELEGGITND